METFVDVFINFFMKSTSAFIGALFGMFIGLGFVLKDSVESNWKKRFREQVKKGVSSGSLKFEDIAHIQERWQQNRQSVLFSLRLMLSDAIASEDEELKSKVEEIRDLIISHEQHEPFSELPENISLQLNSLKGLGEGVDSQIVQLASSLTDLYSSNKTEIAKQKKFAIWGFIVGVLGVLISISSLLIALPQN
ncbi:TPA: hypothetical protein KDZ67_004563 [Vibrio parahaemolyticus]|uniref:hypothetical protein n=1 Tax=Vibrio parahaemolyticus TaxID=670 RepID=UPI0010D84E55|nr:hypothetical protein [Vibrio parahaemolyticus]EHK0839407.1 hypothetical protein [Vibrio parahaemolyticus]EII3139676.1 hypothetical protein [Vibrio parahaemolyticus]EIV8646582.1 hypothetical protein [Vibrio parahaemolyticus]EIV8675685.1 hypothetical protein [Vibrio parahaemolyticus]ELA6986262.1 hypothetical protein [Vibrio parahaemolyticus]